MAKIEHGAAAAEAAVLRVALGRLIRRLRSEVAPNELSWSQKVVLTHLELGPATVSALARKAEVKPQSMSATVVSLQAAGLVEGAPDPSDGRKVLFRQTAACVEMLRAGRAAREDWLARAISRLTEDEQADLPRLTALLVRLAE